MYLEYEIGEIITWSENMGCDGKEPEPHCLAKV